MSPAAQAIIATLLTSLLGLTAGFIILWRQSWVKGFSRYFVSFAAGSLLGAAFFDLLVEAIEENPDGVGSVFGWVTVGFLLFFILEKLLLWHHHGHGHDENGEHRHALPRLLIIGDALHNFLDGTIIAAAFLADPALGVITALAVFFHELPQELGDFSVMLHAGMKRVRVATWNVVGALASPLGALTTIVLSAQIGGIKLPLLGLAAGTFIYIASADLVPEIHKEQRLSRTAVQIALLVLGVLTIIGVGRLLPHGG